MREEDDGEGGHGQKEWKLRQRLLSTHEICVNHFSMVGCLQDFVIKRCVASS
jgi:hypothetical protein